MKGYKRPNWQESSANEQHLQTTLFQQVIATRSYESRQAMLPDVRKSVPVSFVTDPLESEAKPEARMAY